MVGDLVRSTQLRFACRACWRLVVLPLVHLALGAGSAPGLAAAIFAAGPDRRAGCERYLFFTTAPPSRMPGALA